MSFNKTIIKLLKKTVMSDYNEKQLQIANEFRRKQKENLDNYYELRQKHVDAINAASRDFDENKNILGIQLRDVLNTRAELRRQGLQNFSQQIQDSFAEENAIHEKQRMNRSEFFEKKNAHKKAIVELHEACCGTGSFLKNQELQLLAQAEKEYQQSKTKEDE